ncbi:MAG: hypothetical protein QF805_03790 [Pirellulaceae bacterium]|nr:hypothetical protein [Pirellulaceae bacterium]
MAPEQASGSDVDARADIYALGATLFKLLVGAPPHGRSADMPILEYLNRLATNDVKRLDENRDQLPSELVELIASMLQRDPAERTATAAEVADRLLPFAAGADLRELAVSALEKSSASNSEQESAAAVRENLADFWSKPLPTDLEKQPPLPPDSHPHRIGPVGWAALATGVVSVLGLLAFAIVVTLKSPQGDIRIESELDNVRVEVVDEKNKVDVIAVDQDGSTTTVRAGRYRIRLDSPADGIEITPREVVVTKGKTVIAKVKKVASDQPNANPTRDPIAAMEAQLQIEEIETELTKAREQQDPDEAAIGLLEKQLVRLRALSRPIPTEPVYQGRTLADWVAQMHFEQERDAKWAAAESVLKLVETRPVEQRMELILDAGTRMLAWVGRPTDESLHNLLRTGRTVDSSTRTARSSSTTTASKLIVRVDRAEASSHLERALRSDDAQRRDFALLVCAYLREQMRNGDWPSLLSALKSRSETDTGAGQVVSQLVLAASVPDVSSSARLLSSIDAHAASVESLHTAFYAAAERNVDIPRHREIAYTASLFDKAPYAGEFDSVWKTPEIGPFRNVDWDHIEGEMQMDINSVVALLLRSFERRLDAVGDNWANAELQISAAVKSKILTSIIDQANLTGKTRDQGVELLNRRLAQLLHFRAQSAKKPDGAMDTPAAVAVALLLLTGEVPESLKESGRNENGFLAEQLAARKTLIAEDRSVAIPGRSRSGVLSAQAISDLAEWYPYELLDTLHDAASRMNAEVRRTSRWGRSSRSNPMAHMTLQYGLTRIDVRLAIDYAASASDDTVDTLSAAEFVSNSITEMEAKQYLMRHPEFRGAVNDLMNHARNQHAVELGFNIWRTAQSDDDADAKLLDWLKTGSAPRARTAMQRLAVRNDTFSSKWREFQRDRAKDYAAAIDRIAAEQQLTARDIYFLSEMAGDSPSAGPHAVKYLAFWLDNPQKRAREAAIAGLGRGASSLAPCMFILNRDPQQAQPLKQQIQQALDDPDGALAVEDRAQLTGLLRSLLNKGE